MLLGVAILVAVSKSRISIQCASAFCLGGVFLHHLVLQDFGTTACECWIITFLSLKTGLGQLLNSLWFVFSNFNPAVKAFDEIRV